MFQGVPENLRGVSRETKGVSEGFQEISGVFRGGQGLSETRREILGVLESSQRHLRGVKRRFK